MSSACSMQQQVKKQMHSTLHSGNIAFSNTVRSVFRIIRAVVQAGVCISRLLRTQKNDDRLTFVCTVTQPTLIPDNIGRNAYTTHSVRGTFQ